MKKHLSLRWHLKLEFSECWMAARLVYEVKPCKKSAKKICQLSWQ